MFSRIQEELLGRYFSSRGELRGMAEAAGFSFVPVEIVRAGEHEALAVLRPKGVGEVRVRAVRPTPTQRFYITAVELA